MPIPHVARLYGEHGWSVAYNDEEVFTFTGEMSGLTAVRGPARAASWVRDMKNAWFITDSDEHIVLYRRPDHPIKRVSKRIGVDFPESWQEFESSEEGSRRWRKRRELVEFEVLADDTRIVLPPFGDRSWTWMQRGNAAELQPLPVEFDLAARAAERMKPTPLNIENVPVGRLVGGRLCREGEVGLVFGNSGVGVTMLLLGAAVDHLADPQAHVLFLDYDGNGAREIGSRLASMGLGDTDRFQYVESPGAFSDPSDLEHLLRPNLLVLLDSLPAMCQINGRTDRLGENVVPVLRGLQRFARSHTCTVLIADKAGRGRRPRGASEKVEIVQAAWHVSARVPISRVHDGLLAVVKAGKDRSAALPNQQLVAVHTSGRLRMEWDATDAVERARAVAVEEQARADVLDLVARRPRQLTKHELTNIANLAGSRDLRRVVVEKMETEGLLRPVKASRSESGRARTRTVYEVVEAT